MRFRDGLIALLLFGFWAVPSFAQNNTLPQTVSDQATADDLDYLFQKIVSINGVSSSGTISNAPFWSGINGGLWNTNSGNVGIGPLGAPQNPKFQLDVNGNINTNNTLSASTAVFGLVGNISTFSSTGNLALVAGSTITWTQSLTISTPNASYPFVYMTQNNAGLSVNTTTYYSGIPMLVQGQFRDVYDPTTNGGGQEVLVSKSGKAWDWTAGYSGNQNAFVMDETGVLGVMVCLPSGGNAPLCGINNNSVTIRAPSYAWDVAGDINNTGVYRSNATAGINRTCTTNQVPNSDATLGGIVTGGSCDSVRDNQVVHTTAAIISGRFQPAFLASTVAYTVQDNNWVSQTWQSGSSVTLQGTNGNFVNSASVTASGFFGDGSHLTGLVSTPSIVGVYVNKTGDTMTGMLNMNASSITLSNSSITLTGTKGLITSGSSITASSFWGDGTNITGVIAVQCATCTPSNLYVSNNAVIGTTFTVTGNSFSVGGSTLIINGGNVGISSNPASLFVVGNSTFIVNSAGQVGINMGTTTIAPGVAFDMRTYPNNNWEFLNNGVGNRAQLACVTDQSLAYARGILDANPLVINANSGSQVGIFTANPGTGLDVSTSASISGDFIVGGSTIIATGGWVGIDMGTTTTPTASLMRFVVRLSPNKNFIYYFTNNNPDLIAVNDNSNAYIPGNIDMNPLILNANSSGNILVGTTSGTAVYRCSGGTAADSGALLYGNTGVAQTACTVGGGSLTATPLFLP